LMSSALVRENIPYAKPLPVLPFINSCDNSPLCDENSVNVV